MPHNTLIEVASPITAFCGLNGTGKSTLLQLAAASYAAPDPIGLAYYIRTFLDAASLTQTHLLIMRGLNISFGNKIVRLKSLTISRGSHKVVGVTGGSSESSNLQGSDRICHGSNSAMRLFDTRTI